MCDFKYRRNCGIGFYSYNEPKLLGMSNSGRMDHRGTLQLICHLLRSSDHLIVIAKLEGSICTITINLAYYLTCDSSFVFRVEVLLYC
ncbi:unnamed protein product [Urochloa humidicola]